jgi:DNA-binding beta-propeller fold protein YncE
MEPGSYKVTAERKGFEPYSATVELKRGQRLTRKIELIPQPFELSFAVRPAGATVVVTRAHGENVKGAAPGKLTVPAGQVSVSVTKDGFNTFTTAFFLEEPRSFDLILDPKGQLVHALGSIDAAGAPKGVALTPDGKEAWSAILNGPPSIQVFEPLSGRKTGSIDLGKAGAVEVIFNRAGTRAYVSQMETALKDNS